MPKYLMLNGKNAFPNVTYEDFLIEVINGSQFFRSKCSFMEHYVLTTEQSNGEDDAYTTDYQLDFKLLVGENVMRVRSRNMPEVDYSQTSKGFVFTKTKEQLESIPDETILSDLKKCSVEDIRNAQYANNTIKSVVKNIEKPKNLFMYYPYEFLKVSVFEYKLYIPEVLNAFKNILTYRDELNLGKDTFVCIKVNSEFEIFEWKNGKLEYRDRVSEYLSSNYLGLKAYSVY